LWNGATEVGQQFYKAVFFLALGGVVSGPVRGPFHPLTIRDRSRITRVIWLIYAEFFNVVGVTRLVEDAAAHRPLPGRPSKTHQNRR
jgi:hypothetical protein